MDDSTPAPEAPRESAWRGVPWRLSDVAIALAPLAIFRAAVDLVSKGPVVVQLAVLVLLIGWTLRFPLWMARRRGGRSPRLPRPRRFAIEFLIAIPTLVVVWLALGAGLVAWELITGSQPEPQNPLDRMFWSSNAAWRVVVLLLVVTVGSVAEEMLFRGLVYNALRQRMPAVAAALLQAVAFGFVHPYGVVHSVLVAVMSLAFVAVYEWRKTLLAPILLHVFQNIAVVLMAAAAAYSAANAPVLGVSGEPAEEGCRITIVAPGSAAEAAGLRPGDVITIMDGDRVVDFQDLVIIVRNREVGDTIVIEFVRDGERRETSAVLRRRE